MLPTGQLSVGIRDNHVFQAQLLSLMGRNKKFKLGENEHHGKAARLYGSWTSLWPQKFVLTSNSMDF